MVIDVYPFLTATHHANDRHLYKIKRGTSPQTHLSGIVLHVLTAHPATHMEHETAVTKLHLTSFPLTPDTLELDHLTCRNGDVIKSGQHSLQSGLQPLQKERKEPQVDFAESL